MAKYKIGDKVRVRSDLMVNKTYDGTCNFTTSMNKLKTKIVTICKVDQNFDKRTRYKIEESMNVWTDEMFEPIFKVGDKVKLRDNLVTGHKYGNLTLYYNMFEKLKGKTAIIKYFEDDGGITLKDNAFTYDSEMLELVESADTTTEREDKNMATFRIKNVKTIDNKVVIVEFAGGDIQKAVCMPEDTFDFEKGIEVCVMKHLLGKAGYYKALKDAEKQIKALKENTDKKKADAEAKKRKEAKTAKYKARKAERKRAARVAEMKEAYLAALYEYNGDTEKAVEAVK